MLNESVEPLFDEAGTDGKLSDVGMASVKRFLSLASNARDSVVKRPRSAPIIPGPQLWNFQMPLVQRSNNSILRTLKVSAMFVPLSFNAFGPSRH